MYHIQIPALHHMRLKKKWMFKTIYTQIQTQHQIPHLTKIVHHQALIIQF